MSKARIKCRDNIAGEKDRITLLPVKIQNIRIRNNLPSKQTKTNVDPLLTTTQHYKLNTKIILIKIGLKEQQI